MLKQELKRRIMNWADHYGKKRTKKLPLKYKMN